MAVLVTCKYGDDLIKKVGARVITTLHIHFSDAQGQLTPVSHGIWLKSKLIQAYMVILVTCKNGEDSSKNEGTKSGHNRFPIISIWGFFQRLNDS